MREIIMNQSDRSLFLIVVNDEDYNNDNETEVEMYSMLILSWIIPIMWTRASSHDNWNDDGSCSYDNGYSLDKNNISGNGSDYGGSCGNGNESEVFYDPVS